MSQSKPGGQKFLAQFGTLAEQVTDVSFIWDEPEPLINFQVVGVKELKTVPCGGAGVNNFGGEFTEPPPGETVLTEDVLHYLQRGDPLNVFDYIPSEALGVDFSAEWGVDDDGEPKPATMSMNVHLVRVRKMRFFARSVKDPRLLVLSLIGRKTTILAPFAACALVTPSQKVLHAYLKRDNATE